MGDWSVQGNGAISTVTYIHDSRYIQEDDGETGIAKSGAAGWQAFEFGDMQLKAAPKSDTRGLHRWPQGRQQMSLIYSHREWGSIRYRGLSRYVGQPPCKQITVVHVNGCDYVYVQQTVRGG